LPCAMTVLKALAILEAGVLESKKRNVDTPEMREALDFLEPHIYPKWLVPQYCDHVLGHDRTSDVALEGQQRCFAQLSPASVTRSAFYSKYEWTDSPLNSTRQKT
jgi:hypothetical protein